MSDYGNGPELVVGSFYTIRVFHVIEVDGGIFLYPAAVRGKPYRNSDWYTADCAVRYNITNLRRLTDFPFMLDLCRDVAWIKRHLLYDPNEAYFPTHSNEWEQIPIERVAPAPKHDAPDRGCACGFYSFYSLLRLRSELYGAGGGVLGYPSRDSVLAVAVVENAGRVLHGSRGIRSERMRIRGIYVTSPQALATNFPLRAISSYSVKIATATTPWNGTSRLSLRYGTIIDNLEQNFSVFPTLRGLQRAYPLSPRPF